MNDRRRAVLFDLDGTLIDTAPDFYACLNQLRSEEGLSTLDYARVRAEVSNGGSALIRLAFGLERGEAGFDPLLQRLLTRYRDQIADHSHLFEGMANVLDWLEQQQWPWGIVTNKPERFSQPLLEALHLNRRCDTLICPEQVQHTKPDPEGLLLACRQLNCRPADSIYVGDHPRDIEAGKNAGLTTVTALFGYLPGDSDPGDWGADFDAESASALLSWLQALHSSPQHTGTRHV